MKNTVSDPRCCGNGDTDLGTSRDEAFRRIMARGTLIIEPYDERYGRPWVRALNSAWGKRIFPEMMSWQFPDQNEVADGIPVTDRNLRALFTHYEIGIRFNHTSGKAEWDNGPRRRIRRDQIVELASAYGMAAELVSEKLIRIEQLIEPAALGYAPRPSSRKK